MAYHEIPLQKWQEISGYAKRRWIFRGQGSAKWHLTSSLERVCARENVRPDNHIGFEDRLYREFRRAYHHYSHHLPATTDKIEWLSLMQHHGTPTRLVDFTYSLYVAMYFAFKDAQDSCAIWAVNLDWALEQSIQLMAKHGKKNPELLKKYYEESDMQNVPTFFFETPYVPCICPQNPFRLNQRLQIQKGLFLIPGAIAMSFEDNLFNMPGHDNPKNVIKLTILGAAAQRQEVLSHLFEMNISDTTLFPGLDGFARSLGTYHPFFTDLAG